MIMQVNVVKKNSDHLKVPILYCHLIADTAPFSHTNQSTCYLYDYNNYWLCVGLLRIVLPSDCKKHDIEQGWHIVYSESAI